MAAISKDGRQALIDYKYRSSLKGWLDSNIMNDFWEKVVSFCPLFVAPNVITFVGTIQYLLCLFIFLRNCTDFATCVDPSLYYMLGASLFIYQTLDAIDGKQARRTKQSSPLGQLFDHGNDAFITTPITASALAVLQFGTGWICVGSLMTACVLFFSINWRARHCGVMTFGIISVTETQLSIVMLYILTAIFGCDIWQIVIFGIDCKNWSFYFFIFVAFGTIYGDYRAVQKYYREHEKKEDPGQVYELLHMLLFVMGFVCWNICEVFTDYPWIYVLIASFVFSGIIHRLIVADVTHMKTTKYYHLLNPLWLMIFGSLLEYVMSVEKTNSVMNSSYVVYGILIYVIIFWSSYVSKVIDEICDTLNIGLFVINPPKINLK